MAEFIFICFVSFIAKYLCQRIAPESLSHNTTIRKQLLSLRV